MRGRGFNGYCMCRIGDSGGYTKDNVYIDTIRQNSTLGRTLAHEENKTTDLLRLVNACGGRRIVADEIGVDSQYLSSLCCDNSIPTSWFENGRAEKLVQLAAGDWSVAAIREKFSRPSWA